MKKSLKVTLAALVAASTFATTASATMTPSFYGTAEFKLAQTTSKTSSTSSTYMDMEATEATLGFNAEEKGDWTTTANFEISANEAGTFAVEGISIGVATDSVSYTVGLLDPSGVTAGGAYLGEIDDSYAVGEDIFAGPKAAATVGLLSEALTITYGANKKTDTSSLNYNETTLHLGYTGAAGSISYGASYTSIAESINADDSSASATGGAYDGGASSSVAIGVGIGLSDSMELAVNIDSQAAKAGNATDTTATTVTGLGLDFGLGEGAGISAILGTSSISDGSSNATASTSTVVSYATPVGAAIFAAAYSATTTKDDDTSQDDSTSTVGVSLTTSF